MTNQKYFQRHVRKAVIGALAFHDWTGELVNRIKGRIDEKEIGFLMISDILSRFEITIRDFERMSEERLMDEANVQRGIDRRTWWDRNKQGNII